jgi:uncharacterized membrane protein
MSPRMPLLRRASTRVGVAVAAGAVAAAMTGRLADWDYAATAGWDVAAIVFLAWTWLVVGGMDAASTASHATWEDPTKRATTLILLAACVASLAAVGYVLVQANEARGAVQALVAALGVASVAVSWLVVHTIFMLRYAVLYYAATVADGRDGSGIDFNQSEPPKYTDFAYLAFTIGMTFQVSDTPFSSSAIRATGLRHALLSYLFGTFILAATVNLIASLAGSTN